MFSTARHARTPLIDNAVLSLPVFALVFVVSAGMSPVARAQAVLEEVIVTARKREESIQDVPISVTSIGRELREASLRRLDDIQSFTPNVYIRNTSGTPGGAAISIRGVTYQEIDKSFDPSIGVIMEGMYLGTSSGSLLQNFDIGRVEVLRGPQGTLFGKNTIGGVINVIRSDVTMDWGLDARVTIGEDGREDYRVVGNIPIVEDKLGLKLFGMDLNSDGWIDNTTFDDEVGGDDYQTLGFTALWTPTDDLSFRLFYEHEENETDAGAWANFNQLGDFTCLIGLGVFGPPLWPASAGCADFDEGSDEDHNSTNRPNYNDTEIDSTILTVEWDFDNFAITSITAYREQDEANRSEFDGSSANFLNLEYFNDYEQFSQELRIVSDFSETIEFVAGLYYWESEYEQYWNTGEFFYVLDQLGFLSGVPGGLGFPPTILGYNTQNQETTSYAAFFSGDWHITDKWTLTAGLRWTYEEKDFEGTDATFYVRGTPRPNPPTTKFDDDWDEVSPRIGLQYQATDDIMLFGSYAEGFKSGGFFGRQASFQGIEPAYDPEYVDTWEFGMKSTWLNGRLIFNPSVFYSDYQDKQEEILIPIGPGNVATIVRNASTLEIFGGEVELQFQVTEAWNVRANYGYIDAEYDDYIADLNGDGMETDNSDLIPRNTPENSFGLSTTYTIPIGPGEFVGFAAYRWRDEVEVIANNDPLGHMDDIENLDVTLNYIWNDGRYRITAYGRNITDEREAVVVRIPPYVSFGQYNQGENYGVEIAIKI